MNSETKFKKILDKIENKSLVLPDFQRDYVWIKEEDKVKEFIASVLAQLPLGSIITFTNKANSFANKEIGFNNSIEFDNDDEKVSFLLDGQQRVTTLDLVFSDRIFKEIKLGHKQSKDLIQRERIKRRYFLKLPTFLEGDETDDFFNLESLEFPCEPENFNFCSNDIIDLIISVPFNDKNDEWYSPQENYLGNIKEKIVTEASKKAWIPLYLLTDHPKIIQDILKMIVNSNPQINYIINTHNIEKIKEYINNHSAYNGIDLNQNENDIYDQFKDKRDDLAYNWCKDMCSYLSYCIDALKLTEIDITNDNISRAINMYEALNRGGVKLSTYDLVVARAANYKQDDRGRKFDANNKKLLSEYISDDLKKELLPRNVQEWNSKTNLGTIKKSEIVPIIIKQFLNLLCFVAFENRDGGIIADKKAKEELSTIYCKARKQLDMTPEQIVENSNLVLKSLIDACMILQFKCGIYKITEIEYNLILFPLGYMMYLYNAKIINNSIDDMIKYVTGFYLYCIFTGEYKSDQSVKVMEHVKLVHNWLVCGKEPDFLKQENVEKLITDRVLNIAEYNDFETLIYNNKNYPKKGVRNSILQFVLSQNPRDIVPTKNNQYQRLYSYKILSDNINVHIHHIYPLASSKTINEKTSELRNANNCLNSPLNLAIITREANNKVGPMSPIDYHNETKGIYSEEYYFNSDITNKDINNILCPDDNKDKKEFINILKNRYNNIKNVVIRTIKDCFKLA